MSLTRKQQHALAYLVLQAMGELVDDIAEAIACDDIADSSLRDVDPDDVALQLGRWGTRLPGYAWDHRLPDPRRS